VPTPIHFTVLRNDIPDITPEEIMKLCFKLCYTYYNYSGSVKVPAPVKYADRQAAYIGEQRVRPHGHHEDTKGLYFL
jgi:aubergine-like protein